jgi:hypothetical protein
MFLWSSTELGPKLTPSSVATDFDMAANQSAGAALKHIWVGPEGVGLSEGVGRRVGDAVANGFCGVQAPTRTVVATATTSNALCTY